MSCRRGFLLAVLVLHAATVRAQMDVVTVPFVADDPTSPHLAYNGHPTRLKAMARGGGCDTVFFRWDVNGDGTWDQCTDRGSPAAGGWYQDDRYTLDCLVSYPDAGQRTSWEAIIEAACTTDGSSPSAYGTYPVLVMAEVPRGRSANPTRGTWWYTARPPVAVATCSGGVCAETGFPCATDTECEGDDGDSLAVKRAVAVDDAIWYLHTTMVRSGQDTNTIVGRPDMTSPSGTAYRRAEAAAFLRLLAANGHHPAFPPDTYVHGTAGDVAPLPGGWEDANDSRYATDPYAEDALRLFNWLVSSDLTSISVDAAAESDDGLTPVPGTNDLIGLYSVDSDSMGRLIAALAVAGSGLNGATIQNGLGPAGGHSVEFLVQQLVDAASYRQSSASATDGGWYYTTPSTQYALGHATQAMVMGLDAADRHLADGGVIVNFETRARLANYLLTHQDSNGSGIYRTGMDGGDPHYTGGLVHGHGWLGVPGLASTVDTPFAPYSSVTNAQLVDGYDAALGYLASSWDSDSPSPLGWNAANWSDPSAKFDGAFQGATYTHFLIANGLTAVDPGPAEVAGRDWRADYSYYAVNNQHQGGWTWQLWCDNSSMGCSYASVAHNTAMVPGLVLTLIQRTAPMGPVAVAAVSPSTVTEGCAGGGAGWVSFSHDGSFHPGQGSVVDHRWVFDTAETSFEDVDWAAIPDDGSSADGLAWHSSDPGAVAQHQYMAAGFYTAALRVVDDQAPAATDDLTVAILVEEMPELAPTAEAGGPYTMWEGEDLVLGGASADANASCGDEVTVAWDLDGDGVYDDHDEVDGTVAWAKLEALARDETLTVTLQAVDSTGRVDTDTTTLLIRTLPFFSDGFESGGTGAWSSVVP